MNDQTKELSQLFNKIVNLHGLENVDTDEENVELLYNILNDDIFKDNLNNINQCVQIIIVQKLIINYKDDNLILNELDNWIDYFTWIDREKIEKIDGPENGNSGNIHFTTLQYEITLELLIALLNTSVFNLQNMANSDKIRKLLYDKIFPITNDVKSKLPKKILLKFIEIYSMLLTVRGSAQEIYQVYNTLNLDSSRKISKLLLQNLNNLQFENYILFENYYQHLGLHSSKLSISTKKNKLHNFTLHFWIELNNITSNRLFTLDHDFFIEVKDSKLCFANDEFVFALFENFEFSSDLLYSIALCLNNDTEWVLYVNGIEINTISSFFIPRLQHLEVGSMICSFKLYGFCIWSIFLPFECIDLIYKLGINYNPQLNQFDGVFVNKYNTSHLNDHVKIYNNFLPLSESTYSNSSPNNHNIDVAFLERCFLQSNIENLSFNDYLKVFRKITFNKLLISYDVVSTINQFADEPNLKLSFHCDSNLMLGNIFYFRNTNLKSKLMSVDFYFHIINNLQGCTSLNVLFDLLEHLINSWKSLVLKEYFIEKIGYDVLSSILLDLFTNERTLKLNNDTGLTRKNQPNRVFQEKNMGLTKILELFLKYCGYDPDHAEDLILRNIDAYNQIVFNLQIWFSDDNAAILIYRHLTDLIVVSEFKHYNFNQLKKIDAFWSLCKYTHLNIHIDSELKKYSVEFYYNYLLLEGNSRILRNFVQYVVFLVQENDLTNFDILLTVLDVLFGRYCEKQLNLLIELLSPKLLLFILDELARNRHDIIPTLCIFLKIISFKECTLLSFIKNNGVSMLFHILSGKILDSYKECIDILISFAFEGREKSQFIERIDDTPRISFLELAIELLEYAVLNDILLDNSLNNYIFSVFIRMEEFDKEYEMLDSEFTDILTRIMDLLITLKKPQNNDIYSKSASCLESILEKKLILSLNDPNNFENFLARIGGYSCSKNTIHFTNITGKNNRYLDLFLFYNLVPHVFDKLVTEGIQKEVLTLTINLIKLLDTFKSYYTTIKCSFQFICNTYEVLFTCLENCYESNICNSSIKKLCEDIFVYYMKMFAFFVFNNYFGWTTEQHICFYKKLLIYQSLIFGFNKDDLLKKFLFFAFLIDLKNNKESSSLCTCIRTIIHFNHDTIESLIFENTNDSNKVKENLKKLISSEDEEIVALLNSELLSFTSEENIQIYKILISRYLCLQANITPVNLKTLNDKINERKDEHMNFKYQELSSIKSKFQQEKEKFENDIITGIAKSFNNYIIDIDEKKKIQKYKLYKMNFEYSHKTKVLNDENEKIEWMIDNEENSERMRMKLVPYFDPKYHEEKSIMNKMKANSSYESLISMKKGTAKSMLSYDLLSDIDVVGIREKTKNENRKVLNMIEKGDSIENIWNCCLVLGLDLSEGILILGETNFYYISSFYYDSERIQILNLDEVPKEKRDLNINFIDNSSQKDLEVDSTPFVYSWKLCELEYVSRKPFLLCDVAIEIIFSNKGSLFLNFENKNNRNNVFNALNKFCLPKTIDDVLLHSLQELSSKGNFISSWNGITAANLTTRFTTVLSNKQYLADGFEATKLWKQGKLSNFYYLMIINTIAGRSFNDITQYPIFPWVIADYTSAVLNLDDPKTYRDLSKPMGAQSEKRANVFIERYEAMKSLDDSEAPPFHYGTHYSSAMIVSSFLLRLKPFTKTYLLLQDGHFGPVDRLFNSINRTWLSASKENATDVRELIPEFYYLPEFLVNTNHYQFGQDQNGNYVDDVTLPPWAHGDPKLFINLNRKALESKYVTENLHKWIDLIFGYKQRGENAVTAVNVFNYLSYPGAIKLDNIVDENERRAMTNIIYNFGQTPLQIFQEPHPIKSFSEKHNLNDNQWTELLQKDSAQCTKNGESVQCITVTRNNNTLLLWRGFSFSSMENIDAPILKSMAIENDDTLILNGVSFYNTHLSRITNVKIWSEDTFITGDDNGLVKIWKYELEENSSHKLIKLSQLSAHLSSIKQIDAFIDCNILVTLDSDGVLYTWNISNFQMIRKIDGQIRLMCVSSIDGYIAALDSNENLSLYNINGSKFTDLKLDGFPKITSMSFMEILSISKIHEAKHDYHFEMNYVVLGHIDGSISIFHMIFNDKKIWECKHITKLTTGHTASISSISSVLLEEVNNEIEPNLEICAGFDDGKIICFQ